MHNQDRGSPKSGSIVTPIDYADFKELFDILREYRDMHSAITDALAQRARNSKPYNAAVLTRLGLEELEAMSERLQTTLTSLCGVYVNEAIRPSWLYANHFLLISANAPFPAYGSYTMRAKSLLWNDPEAFPDLKRFYDEFFFLWYKEFKKVYDDIRIRSSKLIRKILQHVATGDSVAIEVIVNMLLSGSSYTNHMPWLNELLYIPGASAAIISIAAPEEGLLSPAKRWEFSEETGRHHPIAYTTEEKNELLENFMHQMVLGIAYEVFNFPPLASSVSSIIVNVMKKETCVLSVMVSRDQFADIDISRVDPAACLLALGMLTAGSLADAIPVCPINFIYSSN